MDHAVAIVGMGAQFPGAPDLPAFNRMIRAGAVHLQPVPRQRWDHAAVYSPNPRAANRTPARAGSFLADIDLFAPEFFGITPKRARLMDPQQRLLLEVSRQALEDAGYARRVLAERRVGVYVGASSSDHRTLVAGAVNLPCDLAGRSGVAPRLTAEEVAAVTAALPAISGYSIVGQQLNMLAANVSQAFDFTGPAFAVDTACSSALTALHEAVLHLRSGIVDAAIVGGVYVQLDPIMMVCFSRIGALSFSDRCRPFAADADGFVLGEGAGAVVIKRLADALRTGDRVLAVIRGVAMNNDGRGGGPLTPLASGQAAAIAAAWREADCPPATVGLLEAHATATLAGDGVELAAIRTVFSRELPAPAPITSIKANIGHGLASAGIASLIKATLAVHEGIIPPQPRAGALRAEFQDETLRLRVPERAEPWPAAGGPRRAGVSAFGFGGTNVHVVLEEPAPRGPRARTTSAAPVRIEISAPTRALLAAHVAAIAEVVSATQAAPADVAYTLAQRRRDTERAAFTAATTAELQAQLAALRVAEEAPGPLPDCPPGADPIGELVSLPPSPLELRRFWLIDETRRRPAADLAATSPHEPVPASTAHDGQVPLPPDNTLLALIAAAVSEVTARPAAEVQPEHRFAADLGFDSLTTLEFVTVLTRGLPGVPPPPRTLFTMTLTVAQLAEHLSRVAPTVESDGGGGCHGCVFESGQHPWLSEHRPGHRAVLPLAALMVAARQALLARDERAANALADFQILAPIEVTAGRVALEVVVADDLTFTIHEAGKESPVATGAGSREGKAGVALPAEPGAPGPLSLERFQAQFGFHGPALRALADVPRVGVASAIGSLRGDADEIVVLDGMLQVALYWLGAVRGQTAVATGFAAYRTLAPRPAGETLRCVARLAGERGPEFTVDLDLLAESGDLIAQWRGVTARVIEPATGRAESWPEVRQLAERKAALAAAGLAMPYFQAHEGAAGATTRIAGREYLNFSSYNYLGLAGHPAVNTATAAAVARYGTSASASRLASGERPLHGELERALADFLGCAAAIALVSGHATNVTLIGHLLGPEDLVLHDSLAHDCIVSGARLAGARRLVFPHNDVAALADLLARERPRARRALIAVEGVYSMDGDLAPLPAVVDLKRRHDALLLVDEAHSIGVLGATGRGVGEHCGVNRGDVDFWMGTLSKALASCGGYVAGAAAVIDYLKFTLPGFVYSVGLSPANAAAALAALQALQTQPELPRRLQARSDCFRRLCRDRGLDTGASAHAAIVPWMAGSSARALRVAQALAGRGINVQPIFFPAVEEGKARLRFFITAEHTEDQLRATADALADAAAAENKSAPAAPA